MTADGERSAIGHLFWVIDPAAMAGQDTYLTRIEALIELMMQDAEVRLPGERRRQLASSAARDGIDIPAALLDELTVLT